MHAAVEHQGHKALHLPGMQAMKSARRQQLQVVGTRPRKAMKRSPPRSRCGSASKQISRHSLRTGVSVSSITSFQDVKHDAVQGLSVHAMASRSLQISRKALLPKVLSVQGAEVALRAPFKSPHPNAPARSDVRHTLLFGKGADNLSTCYA